MTSMNAGYVGWSMSKRAAAAYADGEMPKSKWTKAAMLAAIAETLDENDIELTDEQISNLEKLPKEFMFRRYFYCISWHHTSKFANVTEFFAINESMLIDDAQDSNFEYIIKLTICLEHGQLVRKFSTKRELEKYMKSNSINNGKADHSTFAHGAWWYRINDYVI